MDQLQAKANYFRICQLLIDKGGDALRRVLQTKISISPPPSTLDSLLNAHKKSLLKIRYSVINATQWKLLFPPSGSPDSNKFDITLLTILLRNICGLPSPVPGWNVMPPVSDTSILAEILRIKMIRNEVYGHISSAQLDDTQFETLWREISQPLIQLGIRQQDIDELKQTVLSLEEESYIEKLKEWKELEDNLSRKLADIEKEVAKLREEIVQSRKNEGNVGTSERKSCPLEMMTFGAVVGSKFLARKDKGLSKTRMDRVKAKANYTRVHQLLADKGGAALRAALHAKHPASTLSAALNAYKAILQRISAINVSQWNLLFPVSGTPDSKNFDVPLLTILLRNICRLRPPVTGWNAMPPTSDTSISANITRITIFNNEVYRKSPSAQLDDNAFEALWQKISNPLVQLGIPQNDIDKLKKAPLNPEEERLSKDVLELQRKVEIPEHLNPEILPDDSDHNVDLQVLAQLKRSKAHQKILKKLEEKKLNEFGPPLLYFSTKPKYSLGEGCGGTHVYVGILQDGSEVAVKRMLISACKEEAENENDILSLIDTKKSPFIVSYRKYLKDSTFIYLVLDLCEESLDKHVKSQDIEHLRTHGRRMIREILSGLQFLHDQGILHRDIKPKNVLVDVNGHMKLADFGISRRLKKDETTFLTQAKGTHGWMAAEVIRNIDEEVKGRFKKKSDIQPAGMIAFFILTKGKHPFGSTSYDRMKNIVDGKPVDLNKLEDSDGRQFVSRLIVHKIEHRPYAHEALSCPFMANLGMRDV